MKSMVSVKGLERLPNQVQIQEFPTAHNLGKQMISETDCNLRKNEKRKETRRSKVNGKQRAFFLRI